jgi:hypothetical protein
MLTVYHHYNALTHQWYKPAEYNRRSWGFAMPKVAVRHRVAVTNGTPACASTTLIPASGAYSLADQTDAIFAVKTLLNVEDEGSGDLTLVASGFDATDSAWHSLANGRFSLISAWPLATAAGIYQCEFCLFDSTDNETKLPADGNAYVLEVPYKLYTGTEPSAPTGNHAGNWYTGTVANGDSTGTITVTGLTTGGKVIPVITGGDLSSTISAACTTNTVTVSLGGVNQTGAAIPVAVLVVSL